MNLTRELSSILNRVLHIENSILQRIILVRRMEQQVEENIYLNQGDSENPDRNPSPPLPPPPRPDKTPNMTMKKYKTPIIKDSTLLQGDDPVSRMFQTRPSLQDNSTLSRETRRNTITGRESSNEGDSVIARESVRYSKDKPHVRVDSVTSESTRYIEEILHSKRQKSKLVSRYIIVTFVLTNLMLVGFSILGSMLIIPQINPCICPETSPRTEHHIQATQSPTGSESPVLSQSRPKTQTPDHGRNQDTETSQDKKHDNMDQDYSISYFIRVENKTHDDFWTD